MKKDIIRTKEDLREWLSLDAEAYGLKDRSCWHRWIGKRAYGENSTMFSYIIMLRKYEYYKNKKQTIFSKCLKYFYFLRWKRYNMKYGLYVLPNLVGPGLKLEHNGAKNRHVIQYRKELYDYATSMDRSKII